MSDFPSRLASTFRSYMRATHYLAREPGRTWPATLARILWTRGRYRMNPDNLAFFSLDGRWPEDPGEYVHRWYEIEALMKRMNPERAYPEVDDKIVFFRRCLRHGLPTPTIFTVVPDPGNDAGSSASAGEASGSSGQAFPSSDNAFSSSGEPCPIPVSRSPAALAASLAPSPNGSFFCKPLGGINGKGGFGFERAADGAIQRHGRTRSLEGLFSEVREAAARHGAMIVQERLRLHPAMLPVSPSGALSTVRLVTCLEDGVVRPVASLLKICVGDNDTDNFAHGLTGNLIANIDLETGRLSRAVGSASEEFPSMRSVSNHPDSMQPFEGFQLPDWALLRELVAAAHAQYAEFWTLGWDIGLTDRGPVLVEANPVWAVDFLQVASHRGLRHEFDRWEALEEERRRALPGRPIA